MGKTVQIRDLNDETYTVLRTRAAAEHLSLSAYLRRQLEQMAATPSMAEIMERADRRRQRGVHIDGANVVATIRAMRDADDA
jgi:plasmid stability protein